MFCFLMSLHFFFACVDILDLFQVFPCDLLSGLGALSMARTEIGLWIPCLNGQGRSTVREKKEGKNSPRPEFRL